MPGTLSSAIELRRANRLEEAEAACRHVLTCEPGNAGAYTCLAAVLEQLGRPTEALTMCRHAVTLAPQDAEAQLSLGLLSLLLGDYRAGWRGYDWRTRARQNVGGSASSSLPPWDGSDPAGRTILVYCEPDVGDSVQFARYLPLLGGRGADVVLVCPRPLVRLFGSMPGVCVVAEGDPPPRADACIAIGSLPLMFGTTLATIPTFGAYLRADARLAATWRERLRPLRDGGCKLVGLACGANASQACRAGSHIPPDQLAPLAHLPGIRLVALPTGRTPTAGEVDTTTVSFSTELPDVANTAALASQLDLVIADGATYVAHLAGALGKRCWTLVPFAPDWRWALTGDDSPWYPSMRLFRQLADGDWGSVAAEVSQAIKAEVTLSPAPLAA